MGWKGQQRVYDCPEIALTSVYLRKLELLYDGCWVVAAVVPSLIQSLLHEELRLDIVRYQT